MNGKRGYAPEHKHLVFLGLDGQEESVYVSCVGGLLCASTRENRVAVAYVTPEPEPKPSLRQRVRMRLAI